MLTHLEFQQYGFDPCWLYHWFDKRNHLHPVVQAQIFLNCIRLQALLVRLSSPWEWMLLKRLYLVSRAERVNLNCEHNGDKKMYENFKFMFNNHKVYYTTLNICSHYHRCTRDLSHKNELEGDKKEITQNYPRKIKIHNFKYEFKYSRG